MEDEDQQLVCDAIDAATPAIEYFEVDVIQKVFLPQVLPLLDFKSHTTNEITENLASNFG